MSHIVLTRALSQAQRFSQAFPSSITSRAQIKFCPLLDIQHIEFKMNSPELEVIFTSENGVEAFTAQVAANGRRAFCVGDRTAAAAKAAGFDAKSASGTATDLIELIASEGAGEMIYARGEHVARDLKAELAALGIPVQEIIVYAQSPLAFPNDLHTLLTGDGRIIFPLFSGRSMRLLEEAMKGEINAKLIAVCISKNVADAAREGVFAEKHVSAAPNSASMIRSIESVIA